jgi:hypothetical protein
MRRTVQLLLRKALILPATTSSICQESTGAVFRSFPKIVMPTFLKNSVSPIVEMTPMHLPLSAAFGLGDAAGAFGLADC